MLVVYQLKQAAICIIVNLAIAYNWKEVAPGRVDGHNVLLGNLKLLREFSVDAGKL